jgi:fumarylpyruvate hydrolase
MPDLKLAVPAPPLPTLPVAGSDLRFPVRRIYCVGRNYLAHVHEMGNDEKAPPLFFSKAPDMIVEDGSTIPYPPLTHNYHHEVELVIAMGGGGANIPVESALGNVYGYAVGFDMTRRDLQQAAAKAGRPWEVGKSFDQSAPCGAIHPAAQVGSMEQGEIQITVNGQVRQQSNLNLMIWDVAHIIHHLSLQVTLAPGDLIYTGTPEGVSAVVAGDVLVGRIDKLGELTIRIA